MILFFFFLDPSCTSLLPLLIELGTFRSYKTAGRWFSFSGTPVQELTHQENSVVDKFMSSYIF